MKKNQVSWLFETYYSDLILYGIGITKDQKIAEDLVSDAFYKLLLNIDKVALHQCKFWLMRVMKNSYIDKYRKERHLEFYEATGRSIEVMESNHLEKLLQEEVRRDLMENIQKLAAKYTEVMILYYFLELTGKEIAEYLDVSYGQVRTRLYCGRQFLKERLEKDGET